MNCMWLASILTPPGFNQTWECRSHHPLPPNLGPGKPVYEKRRNSKPGNLQEFSPVISSEWDVLLRGFLRNGWWDSRWNPCDKPLFCRRWWLLIYTNRSTTPSDWTFELQNKRLYKQVVDDILGRPPNCVHLFFQIEHLIWMNHKYHSANLKDLSERFPIQLPFWSDVMPCRDSPEIPMEFGQPGWKFPCAFCKRVCKRRSPHEARPRSILDSLILVDHELHTVLLKCLKCSKCHED